MLSTGDAAGSTQQPLGSSCWQSIKGRKQVGGGGQRGGGPLAARAAHPPPPHAGERGSLLLGLYVPPLHREELCPIPKASWNRKRAELSRRTPQGPHSHLDMVHTSMELCTPTHCCRALVGKQRHGLGWGGGEGAPDFGSAAQSLKSTFQAQNHSTPRNRSGSQFAQSKPIPCKATPNALSTINLSCMGWARTCLVGAATPGLSPSCREVPEQRGRKGLSHPPPPHQLKKQQQVLGLPGLFPAGEH